MNPTHHTELIRLLEQRGHLFPADPAAITAQLRQTDGDITDKLHRRATLIDRDHAIADQWQQHCRHRQWLHYAALTAWAMIGFVGTYGLMQQTALNFFVVLLGVLGVNTVMLMIWCVNLILRRDLPALPPFFRQPEIISQTIAQLYHEPNIRPHATWRRSMVSHQLALSGLGGMFAAALLLLLVRQYHFTWESTLLSNETLTQVVGVLAWLPEILGFDVPDSTAILASRNQANASNAAAWGSLLLGSLLCYGLVPRALAWAISAWQVRRLAPQLNLQLPYYQNISQKWQRKIVDSDADYTPDPIRSSPQISLAKNGAYWAIALDVLPKNHQWYQDVLGQEWLDLGVVASREEWADLANRAAGQAVQLLVAVRAAQTPDRGTVRRLAGVGANVVLCLWAEEGVDSGSLKERVAQWQELAQQYGWAWVDNHLV